MCKIVKKWKKKYRWMDDMLLYVLLNSLIHLGQLEGDNERLCEMESLKGKIKDTGLQWWDIMQSLTHSYLETLKRVIGKQCRPTSDVALWVLSSGSTVFDNRIFHQK